MGLEQFSNPNVTHTRNKIHQQNDQGQSSVQAGNVNDNDAEKVRELTGIHRVLSPLSADLQPRGAQDAVSAKNKRFPSCFINII